MLPFSSLKVAVRWLQYLSPQPDWMPGQAIPGEWFVSFIGDDDDYWSPLALTATAIDIDIDALLNSLEQQSPGTQLLVYLTGEEWRGGDYPAAWTAPVVPGGNISYYDLVTSYYGTSEFPCQLETQEAQEEEAYQTQEEAYQTLRKVTPEFASRLLAHLRAFLRSNLCVSIVEIREHIRDVLGYDLRPVQLRNQIRKLIEEGVVTTEGATKAKRYIWLRAEEEETDPEPEPAEPEPEPTVTAPISAPISAPIPTEPKPAPPAPQPPAPKIVHGGRVIVDFTHKPIPLRLFVSQESHRGLLGRHFQLTSDKRYNAQLAGNFFRWASMVEMLDDTTVNSKLCDALCRHLQGRIIIDKQPARFTISLDYVVGWAGTIEKYFFSNDELQHHVPSKGCKGLRISDTTLSAPATHCITFAGFIEPAEHFNGYFYRICGVYPGEDIGSFLEPPRDITKRGFVFFAWEAPGEDLGSNYWNERYAQAYAELIRYTAEQWPHRGEEKREAFAARLGISLKRLDELLLTQPVLAAIKRHKAEKKKKRQKKSAPPRKAVKVATKKRVVFIGSEVENRILLKDKPILDRLFDTQYIDTKKRAMFEIGKPADLIVTFVGFDGHEASDRAQSEARRWGSAYLMGGKTLQVSLQRAEDKPQFQWFVDALHKEGY